MTRRSRTGLQTGSSSGDAIDVLKGSRALEWLTEAAEKAKVVLSGVAEATASLPIITAEATGPNHIEDPDLEGQVGAGCSRLHPTAARHLRGTRSGGEVGYGVSVDGRIDGPMHRK